VIIPAFQDLFVDFREVKPVVFGEFLAHKGVDILGELFEFQKTGAKLRKKILELNDKYMFKFSLYSLNGTKCLISPVFPGKGNALSTVGEAKHSLMYLLIRMLKNKNQANHEILFLYLHSNRILVVHLHSPAGRYFLSGESAATSGSIRSLPET
jgi:hypothetical protein